MAQTKKKRNKPRKSEITSAILPSSASRRLGQRLPIVAALFLAASVTAATLYPKPAETIAPNSYGIDGTALVRSIVAATIGPAQTPNIEAPIGPDTQPGPDPQRSIVLMGGSTPRPVDATPGSNDPKLVGALRTASIAATQTRLYGPHGDPRLQLLTLAPPYVLSGPGSYQTRLAHVSGSIEHSLFETGLSVGLSDRQVLTLAEIFGWDIDFALDVKSGDSFSVIYEEKYWLGRKIDDGPILAAEFINNGRVFRAIGMRAESGQLLYYTPSGRSLKQAFLRTPVKFSHVSSGYADTRYHPILKLWRAHTGIDYAAPAGTPVRATAYGTITWIGWNGGYGRTIEIDHGDTFSTLYAHLSGYRPDLRVGSRVDQGEVIGYVGSSGLATGSHLHYEFRVNGKHRNPLAYQSPESELIPTSKRGEFHQMSRMWSDELDRMSRRYLASR